MDVINIMMTLILYSLAPTQKNIVQKMILIRRLCLEPVFNMGKPMWRIAFSVFCVTDQGLFEKMLLLAFSLSLAYVFCSEKKIILDAMS